MFPVKFMGTCPLKVQQLKIEGHVPARLPGAPMIKPPPQISKANFAYDFTVCRCCTRSGTDVADKCRAALRRSARAPFTFRLL